MQILPLNVGLFFGSFNPIHHGHLILANYILEATLLEEIWFVVSPQNPFKSSEELLSETIRLSLVQLSIEGDDRLRACDVEFAMQRPSYTIETLNLLETQFPQNTFSIIMGEDNLNGLPQWKNSEKILEAYHIYVYPRPEYTGGKHITHPHIIRLKAPLLNISSSLIRLLIKQRKSVRYMLPETVRKEIQNKGYYR